MVESLLMQTVGVATSANLGLVNTLIAFLVAATVIYYAGIKKDPDFRELVTGYRGLLPAIVLGILALIPAASLAMFGVGQGIVSILLVILTAILFGYVIGYIGNWAIAAFEKLKS